MKYYFQIDRRPGSSNYMKPLSVHRWYTTKDGERTEKWNGKEWENNPNLIAAIGLGGDGDYQETSEAQALEFVVNHTIS